MVAMKSNWMSGYFKMKTQQKLVFRAELDKNARLHEKSRWPVCVKEEKK
jgi:hypothetical protein